MNRICPIIILLCVSATLVKSQSPENTEKEIFQSGDNKLYINKDLGIYLWISTSPDPESKKYRLISDSTKNYSNPMYFDTEGYNTFRSPSAVDTSTRQTVFPVRDIIFEVYADGIPPSTGASYNYSVTKNIGGKVFYDENLKVSLKSTDAVSSVKEVRYSVNSDKFSVYSQELSNFRNGENILKYYAVDKVGNVEKTNEVTFYIDNVPPVTTHEIIGNRNNNYISSDAVIKLTATDNMSGVKSIYYQVNKGPFTKYIAPIPAKVMAAEGSVLNFYAEDLIGNKETIKSVGDSENIQVNDKSGSLFQFYVDDKAPATELITENDYFKGNYSYVSARSKFIIKAADDKSGVDKIYYSIDNSKETEYTGPFLLEKKGLHNIRYRAVDFVGNSSEAVTKAFFCDIDAPRSTLITGSPKFHSRDTLFISSNTTVTITSTDNSSGVGSIQYSFDNTGEKIYESGIKIEKSGMVNLLYYATDKVNNLENPQAIQLFVDNDKPVIHHHFSVESIGSKVVRDENYSIYPSNVMLYIAATDRHSGGEKIDYSINGGAVQHVNPVKNFKPGNYLISVSAYDVLGNKSTREIKFSVEE